VCLLAGTHSQVVRNYRLVILRRSTYHGFSSCYSTSCKQLLRSIFMLFTFELLHGHFDCCHSPAPRISSRGISPEVKRVDMKGFRIWLWIALCSRYATPGVSRHRSGVPRPLVLPNSGRCLSGLCDRVFAPLPTFPLPPPLALWVELLLDSERCPRRATTARFPTRQSRHPLASTGAPGRIKRDRAADSQSHSRAHTHPPDANPSA
jgi:hypothetical protein